MNAVKLLYKNLLLSGEQKTKVLKLLGAQFNDLPRIGNLEYTAIEHSPGVVESIFTFRSPIGKPRVIERVRVNTGTNTQSRTFYEHANDFDIATTGHNTMSATTYKYNTGDANPYEFTRHGVDIVQNTKDVTISHNSITHGDNGSTVASSLAEKSNGKTYKQLKRTTGYSKDDAVITDTVEKSGLCPTEEVAADEVLKDKYFHGRFMDMPTFIKTFRKTFLKNQNANSDIPMTPAWLPMRKGSAVYVDKQKRILISDMSKEYTRRNISQMISNLNHEARHVWQYELVEKLEKGQLTDPADIKLAQEFKKNIENYIQPAKAKTYAEYASQPIEADAFRAGNSSNIEYNKATEDLSFIFRKALPKIFGGG